MAKEWLASDCARRSTLSNESMEEAELTDAPEATDEREEWATRRA